MPRKKGAQPGNTNALTHGFYSQFFAPGEITDLTSITADLTDEIAMLRVIIRRLVDRLSTMEKPTTNPTGSTPTPTINYDHYTALVQLLSSSTIRLASLMRTNLYLTGKAPDLGESLKTALEEALDELGVK